MQSLEIEPLKRREALLMYLLLFALWIALNGKITLEIVVFGLILTTVVYRFMVRHLEYNPDSELGFAKNSFRILVYIVVLAWEIIKSSITVMRFVFSKKLQIEPQIVFFKVPLKNEFLKAIFANSITLTPGTITADYTGDVICVHTLDYTLVEDFENSVFIRLLQGMERR